MTMYLVKLLISAGMIVLISEVAKRSPHAGALISALPLVSLIAITWLYYDTGGDTKLLRQYAHGVFWYVIPSLVFFVLFPVCLDRMHFWWSMLLSAAATSLAFVIMKWALTQCGVKF